MAMPECETIEIDLNEEIANALINELTCSVCHIMDSTAKNPLLECVKCNQLYHQLCDGTRAPKDPKMFLCKNCNPLKLIIKSRATSKK